MAMNPLPPQAYTKETLARAYEWLQDQNESIKEMATHPDILVSLYLKARLNGNESLERPSIQNFRTELRTLAGMMGDLESSATVTNTRQTTSTIFANSTSIMNAAAFAEAAAAAAAIPASFTSTTRHHQQPAPQAPHHGHASQAQAPQQGHTSQQASQGQPQPHLQTHSQQDAAFHQQQNRNSLHFTNPSSHDNHSFTEKKIVPPNEGFEIDAKTWQMIREIKTELNLSQESEALRMLISVGYKRLKGI